MIEKLQKPQKESSMYDIKNETALAVLSMMLGKLSDLSKEELDLRNDAIRILTKTLTGE